jgi:hypothetical protein
MFKAVVYESWSVWVPCIAFAVMAGVFLLFAAHAVRLRKDQSDRLSKLPLDN